MQQQETNSIFTAIKGNEPVYIGEARMLIDSPEVGDKMFWIVEGEPDLRFYSQFFDEAMVAWYYPRGCEKVRVIMENLDSRYPGKLFAIVDSDYYSLNGVPEKNGKIFRTDWHDHEMWLVYKTGSLGKVCSNYLPMGNDAKDAENTDKLLLEACGGICNLSYIKWFHDVRKRATGESGLNFGKSAMEAHFGKSIGESLTYIYADKSNQNHKIQITTAEVSEFKLNNQGIDNRLLNVGHDVLSALSFVIKKRKMQNISKSDFYNEFANNYGLDDFRQTGTYNRISSYFEAQHRPSPLK